MSLAIVAVSANSGTAFGSHALSPERYAALDAAYTAMIPLDRDVVKKSALATAQRACERLDTSDALLGPMRRQCLAVVTLVRRAERFARCRTRRGCRRATAGLRRAFTSYISVTEPANRAIDASVADFSCRFALRTPAEHLRGAKRMRSALRAVERAFRTGSGADLRRAERRLASIEDPSPSARQERTRFRSACG